MPSDTRAILRLKTLLGETYIELTPGRQGAAASCPTAAQLPTEQVAEPSSSTRSCARFDETTRTATCSSFLKGAADAVDGPRRRHERRGSATCRAVRAATTDLLGRARPPASAPCGGSCATAARCSTRSAQRQGELAGADPRRRPRARVDGAPQRRPGRDRADPADDAARAAPDAGRPRAARRRRHAGRARPAPGRARARPDAARRPRAGARARGLFRDVDRRDRRRARPRCRRRPSSSTPRTPLFQLLEPDAAGGASRSSTTSACTSGSS